MTAALSTAVAFAVSHNSIVRQHECDAHNCFGMCVNCPYMCVPIESDQAPETQRIVRFCPVMASATPPHWHVRRNDDLLGSTTGVTCAAAAQKYLPCPCVVFRAAEVNDCIRVVSFCDNCWCWQFYLPRFINLVSGWTAPEGFLV